MQIGILGSGLMGGKLGTLFARSDHDLVFSYARSTDKLKRLAKEAGENARAGTPSEATQDADALLLAVHWLPCHVPVPELADNCPLPLALCLPLVRRTWTRPSPTIWPRIETAE